MSWAPIRMTTHIRTYPFGERLIPQMLGKQNVPEGIVAETWEISDQKDARATITSPPFAGRLLHDVVAEFPDEIVGEGWRGPHFPILDKFLDASHPLPVHLHADAWLPFGDARDQRATYPCQSSTSRHTRSS